VRIHATYDFLGASAAMAGTQGVAHPVEEPGLAWRRWAGLSHDPRCQRDARIHDTAETRGAHAAGIIGLSIEHHKTSP
jgi:hypothetical protein